MKKYVIWFVVLSLVLAGCVSLRGVEAGNTAPEEEKVPASAETQQQEESKTICPLPDTTMENLNDAILSVSLEEGDAYVDDEGIMQMDLTIYTYDKYDMADISMLQVGDTFVRQSGETEVTSIEQTERGTLINGGLEAGGFDLVTDDGGIFYETGFNDAKNWYEVGTATIRVSVDFRGIDSADPELGEIELYPGSFLTDEVTDYYFTPHNTTVRVEGGQIVELTRVYTP